MNHRARSTTDEEEQQSSCSDTINVPPPGSFRSVLQNSTALGVDEIVTALSTSPEKAFSPQHVEERNNLVQDEDYDSDESWGDSDGRVFGGEGRSIDPPGIDFFPDDHDDHDDDDDDDEHYDFWSNQAWNNAYDIQKEPEEIDVEEDDTELDSLERNSTNTFGGRRSSRGAMIFPRRKKWIATASIALLAGLMVGAVVIVRTQPNHQHSTVSVQKKEETAVVGDVQVVEGDDNGVVPWEKNVEEEKKIDLSMFGYPHATTTTSSGWVSWLYPDSKGDRFVAFNVTTVEECAATCRGHKNGALVPPFGAWDVEREGCFCSLVDVKHLCKDPCVRREFIEFAIAPFSNDHCDEDLINFDQDDCHNEMVAPSPTTSSVTASKTIESVDIVTSAVSTAKYSVPGAESVENDEEHVAFVRFNLTSISESDNIESATLHLYLARSASISDSEEAIHYNVTVRALPQSTTEDWSDGSVLYRSSNETLGSEGDYFVESFGVFPSDHSFKIKLHRVDVMSAVDDPSPGMITFEISTSSDVRLDFVRDEQGALPSNSREALPHLTFTFSRIADVTE
mmetsp:Transcript_3946/g.8701  ORF Transcript_3946/g.8701 Transcript_3946/m.8701 type:complete len:566 (+) Transcript_3946:102-1799(+)